MKILVVEDDEAVNQLLCRRLEREGYQVRGILTARELINAMEMGQQADLMLLDFKLHDLDAAEVVQTLKQMKRLIPFIVCTGVGSEVIAVKMMKEGARDYLVKDKSFLDVLPSTVKKVLREINIENQLAEARQKLDYQNAVLSAVHELSLDGIVVVDESNQLVSCNKKFCDLWHLPDQATGEDIFKIFKLVSEKLKNGGAFLTELTNLDSLVEPVSKRHKDLELLSGEHFELYSTPMKRDDSYFGHIWYFRDVTLQAVGRRDIEKARLQAERSAKAKAEFLANFSHEIRTPLNSLGGFLELLALSELNDEQKSYFDAVKLSCKNLSSLIDNTLNLSKLEAGATALEKLLFNIEETLSGSMIMVESVRKPEVELELSISPDIPPVVGDSLRLQQVIVNLLSNALKFTSQGKVKVSCEQRENDFYHFRVEDSGIGIEPARQQEIFEAFQQESISTSRNHGGTGLGLSISARIVRLMNGELKVESTPGCGSTFYFDIKLDPLKV